MNSVSFVLHLLYACTSRFRSHPKTSRLHPHSLYPAFSAIQSFLLEFYLIYTPPFTPHPTPSFHFPDGGFRDVQRRISTRVAQRGSWFLDGGQRAPGRLAAFADFRSFWPRIPRHHPTQKGRERRRQTQSRLRTRLRKRHETFLERRRRFSSRVILKC